MGIAKSLLCFLSDLSHMQTTTRRPVAIRQPFSQLRDTSAEGQRSEGYIYTLSEIWQQPELWRETAQRVIDAREVWQPLVARAKAILLTGSGSSYFVGKCIAAALQESTLLPVAAVESGEVLMLGKGALPPTRPLLVVSFARSGDSPESAGLVQQLLDEEPAVNHLVITCNPQGRLARNWGAGQDSRVRVLVLDERSCDQSLVMTSSFTSMAVAGLGVGYSTPPYSSYLSAVETLSSSVGEFLANGLGPLEGFPWDGSDRMLCIGNGATLGAAWEVGLKMLEMTAGRVMTRAEGCLGLRHGPMCALTESCMLFAVLSSHPMRRGYQIDLLTEINAKRLAGGKIIVGGEVPADVLSPGDVALELPALRDLGDEWVALAGVVAGQLLAFLRCRAEGLQPDQPVSGDSISRVVGGFTLYSLGAGVS